MHLIHDPQILPAISWLIQNKILFDHDSRNDKDSVDKEAAV